MKAIHFLIFTTTVFSIASAAPQIGRALSTFPILECPDEDSTLPQVVLVPSVAGVELSSNQYVVCIRGVPFIYNCSAGLFFDWSTMSCDFPYEKSHSSRNSNINGTSPVGDLDLLVPAGPIQVPTAPHLPIPWRRRGQGYPVTKPDPSVIMPIPVIPWPPAPGSEVDYVPVGPVVVPDLPHVPIPYGRVGYPLPSYPVTKPNPAIVMPLPVLPAHPHPSSPPFVPLPPHVPYYVYY